MQNVVTLLMVLSFCSLSTGILSACSFPGVYKIDVQQGNIIEAEALDQLQPGMNRKQVHFVLGSPVLESTFSPEYESYLYTIQIAGGDIQRQNILLHYSDNGILEKIEKRTVLPAELANPAEARKIRAGYKERL